MKERETRPETREPKKVNICLRFALYPCKMFPTALIFVASLPLFVVPDQWLELSTYWSAAKLNTRPGEDGSLSRWRNVGWWQVGALASAISIIIHGSHRRPTFIRKQKKL